MVPSGPTPWIPWLCGGFGGSRLALFSPAQSSVYNSGAFFTFHKGRPSGCPVPSHAVFMSSGSQSLCPSTNSPISFPCSFSPLLIKSYLQTKEPGSYLGRWNIFICFYDQRMNSPWRSALYLPPSSLYVWWHNAQDLAAWKDIHLFLWFLTFIKVIW